MKIKEIKLFGFKSFREETNVLLNAGVTAFVGPNGSGKSNIFDALRWVFGEQSMKALRCEKIEDLVYISSDSKEDANFTEVAVTIDNEEYFPQFGSEFEIRRRFYRTGESEFFLNRVKCRLHDIQALFLNSGALTYSFLELAEVERIIHGDTKEMFDDVAGILKYQERKEQTKRRLDATEQDLMRLEDIIVEMQRGLRRLKRQVRQARLFNELRTEFKDLSLLIMSRGFKTTLQEIASIESQVEGKETERQALLQSIKQLEHEREQLKEAIASAETEKKSNLAEIVQLNQAIESLESEIAEKEQEVRDKTIMSERILTSIKEKQELANASRTRLSEFEDERKEVLANVETTQSKIEELRKALDAKNEDYFSIERSLKENEDSMSEIASSIIGAKSDISKLTYDRENKDDLLSRAAQEIETQKTEIEKIRHAKKKLEEEFDGIVTQQSEADKLLRSTHERSDELTRKLSDLDAELESRNEAIADCKILIDTLQRRLQVKGRKEIEDRFGKKVTGMLKDSLAVTAGYEAVVDICLSDLLGYYLLKDYRIEDFQSCPEGRFGFIDIEQEAKLEKDIQPEDGVPISQFMKFKSAPKMLARHIQNYFLVEDLSRAHELSAKYPEAGFVTPQGVLFKKSTIVVEKGEVGYFKMRQNLEEYKEKLESLRNEALFITEERGRLREELDNISGEIEVIRNQLFDINIKKSECSLKLQEATKEVETKEKELSDIREDQDILRKDNETIARDLATRADGIEKMESGKAAKELERQGLAEQRQKLKGELDDLNAELNRLNTESAVLEQRKSLITKSIEQLNSQIDSNESEIKSLRSESLPSSVSDLMAAIDSLRNRLDEERQKKSAREAELPDQRLDDLNKRQGLVYDQLAQKQKDHESMQDEVMQLKYQLFEKNHKRDDLLRKADEDFGFVLSDYVPEEEIVDAESKLAEVKGRIEKLGEVNPLSLQAYEEEKKRLDEFLGQRDDIIAAKKNLMKSMEELDQRARDRFNESFQDVRKQFNFVFSNFFEDGQADLILTDPDNPLASKVEIVVRMMGRRLKTINQLSGGQKTLLAISLLLAFYLVKPAPFCILDEIDAPLDDINVIRFNKFLRDLSQRTQVVIITHNRATMEYADYLYGLTMEKPRESKVISAKLADLEKITTLEEQN
jgi:chromosome segregation protein